MWLLGVLFPLGEAHASVSINPRSSVGISAARARVLWLTAIMTTLSVSVGGVRNLERETARTQERAHCRLTKGQWLPAPPLSAGTEPRSVSNSSWFHEKSEGGASEFW